jgi:hypothetical protein
MNDIAGPPAPREVQSNVRPADKAASVNKDKSQTEHQAQHQTHSETGREKGDALHSRDPAVAIAPRTAHLDVGQKIVATVSKLDSEGRPIIASDSATFALKPDAGLKPDDSVSLKVIEAARTAVAELIGKNGSPIDPPIRLNLTVIEVHLSAKEQLTDNHSPAPPTSGYRPPPLKNTVTINTAQPAQGNDSQIPLVTNTNHAMTKSDVIDSPKPLQQGQQTSGVNLSPLIEAQQNQAAPLKSSMQNPTVQNRTGTPQASHFFASLKALEGPGLSAPVFSVATNGAPAMLQLVDPAISRVSPAELTTVNRITPLTANEARNLPFGSGVFRAVADPTLVRVETAKGDFIAPNQQAAGLVGETVRLALGTASSSQQTAPSAPLQRPTFNAFLIEEKAGATPQRVAIQFDKQAAPVPTNKTETIASINSVQTVAAFLTPNGPRADIRLDTSRGDISLTLPSEARPMAGDFVRILLPQQTPLETANPEASQTAANAATSSAAVATTATTSPTANMLANWPALQESIASLVATHPYAAAALASKSAEGGAKLTNSLLFFLAAAGRGDAANWIGKQAANALDAQSKPLLRQLQSDIGQLAKIAGDTASEWRPIVIPFDTRSGEAPLAALLLAQRYDIDPEDRDKKSQNENEEKNQFERFLLQVQFSVLGNIQLDGTIQGERFDLTIRAQKDFSPALKTELSELFGMALGANGFKGGLKFREEAQFEVDATDIIESQLMGNL